MFIERRGQSGQYFDFYRDAVIKKSFGKFYVAVFGKFFEFCLEGGKFWGFESQRDFRGSDF